MKLLNYQRVRYVGPRFPELEYGADGYVSDANNVLSKLEPGWVYVEFQVPPRRHQCRLEWLEVI